MEKMFPFYGPSLFITTLANHTRPVIGVLLGKRIGEENGGRELLPRRDGDAITSRLQDEVIGNGRANEGTHRSEGLAADDSGADECASGRGHTVGVIAKRQF